MNQARSGNYQINSQHNSKMMRKEKDPRQFNQKIEISLRRIDDKFNHLNENLQKYQDILKPALEQLDNEGTPLPIENLDAEFNRSRLSGSMFEGFPGAGTVDQVAILNSSRRVISTEHE